MRKPRKHDDIVKRAESIADKELKEWEHLYPDLINQNSGKSHSKWMEIYQRVLNELISSPEV